MSKSSSKSQNRPEVKKFPRPADDSAAVPAASQKSAAQMITPDWLEAKKKLIDEHLGGLEESVKSVKPIVGPNGLIGRSNVHSVYIGMKKRSDGSPGELAIVVQVLKKVTAHDRIDSDALLPPFVVLGDKKYLVDVEQAPMAVCQLLDGVFPGAEKPARPGSAIGTKSPLVGTLGCLVMARRGDLGELKLCILSNLHVLAMDQNAVVQPRPNSDDEAAASSLYSVFQPYGTAVDKRKIGALIDFIDPTLGSGGDLPTTSADAAIAWTSFEETAPERGTFRVAAKPDFEPTMHQGVIKMGFKTGLKSGTITGLHADQQVRYNQSGPPIFGHITDGIIISGSAGPFSNHGDSGSIIVDSSTHKPVALLVGGPETGETTIANPIKYIWDGLKIETFLNNDNWDKYAQLAE
jgi:hypothetical protein